MATYFTRHTKITNGAAASDSNDGLDPLGAALSGATYDHTGGVSGERQLTAASGTPFANSLAGDLIYLITGGSGVATNLYTISSVISSTVVLLAAHAGLTGDDTVSSASGPWLTPDKSVSTPGAGDESRLCADSAYTVSDNVGGASGTEEGGTASSPLYWTGANSRGVVDGTKVTIAITGTFSVEFIDFSIIANLHIQPDNAPAIEQCDNTIFVNVHVTLSNANTNDQAFNTIDQCILRRCSVDVVASATASNMCFYLGGNGATNIFEDCWADFSNTTGGSNCDFIRPASGTIATILGCTLDSGRALIGLNNTSNLAFITAVDCRVIRSPHLVSVVTGTPDGMVALYHCSIDQQGTGDICEVPQLVGMLMSFCALQDAAAYGIDHAGWRLLEHNNRYYNHTSGAVNGGHATLKEASPDTSNPQFTSSTNLTSGADQDAYAYIDGTHSTNRIKGAIEAAATGGGSGRLIGPGSLIG